MENQSNSCILGLEALAGVCVCECVLGDTGRKHKDCKKVTGVNNGPNDPEMCGLCSGISQSLGLLRLVDLYNENLGESGYSRTYF